MADFNAYPALQIKSPELGPGLDLPNLFQQAETIKSLQNRNALFPIEQEALQQQNQLGALSLQHAKQADEYGKISSALQTIGLADNAKDQEAQWNQLMGTFPEGKQWIGKFDGNKLKNATRIYGDLAQQSASIARGAATAAAATRQRAGAGAAGGEEEGTGPSSVGGFDWEGVNVMEPAKKQATLHGISKMVADVDDLARTPADQIQAKWDEYARKDGFENFGAGTQFSPQGLQRLMEFADDAKPHLAALGISAATGVPIKRPDVKQIANQPFAPDTREFLPLPQTENQKAEIAQRAADRAQRAAEAKQRSLDYEARTGVQRVANPKTERNVLDAEGKSLGYGVWDGMQLKVVGPDGSLVKPPPGAKVATGDGTASAGSDIPIEVYEANPLSNGLLAQTGLAMPGFLALTGQASTLPRDQNTRDRAFKQAQDFLTKRNIDNSVLASQYKANNDVVMKNTERANSARIMEDEMMATLENLTPLLDKTQPNNLRLANIVKSWAGEQVNDPNIQTNQLWLGQLREEAAGYFAALQGRYGASLTQEDYKHAEALLKPGLSARGAEGVKNAIIGSTKKMRAVLNRNVQMATKNVWDLFGVGKNYKFKPFEDVENPPEESQQQFPVPPPEAIEMLQKDPKSVDSFRKHFGNDAAVKALGTK